MPPIKCSCGTCQRCKRRVYMRSYNRRPVAHAKNLARKARWRESNRDKARQYTRDWLAAHPGYHSPYDATKSKINHLARRGLSVEEYDDLMEIQGGVCFFCGKPETAIRKSGPIQYLSVDHDHETNKIRGLLCLGCNISLGYFERGMKSRLSPERVALYLNSMAAWV